MEVFVGNLPPATRTTELERLFVRAGGRVRFRIVRRDIGRGRRIRFGLGTIEPAHAAKQAFRLFDGMVVGGCTLTVRPFVRRAAHRERRRVDWRRRPWPFAERRRAERRHRGRFLKETAPRFESDCIREAERPKLVCIRGFKD